MMNFLYKYKMALSLQFIVLELPGGTERLNDLLWVPEPAWDSEDRILSTKAMLPSLYC